MEANGKRFDKDGDGKLNDAERAAAKAAMGNRKPGEGGPLSKEQMAELVKKYDKDGDGRLNEAEKTAARALLDKRYTSLAGVMADRDYLVGNTFSVADVYLFVVNSWANYIKYDLSRWPVLLEFQKRIAARPAVQATLKAEGLA